MYLINNELVFSSSLSLSHGTMQRKKKQPQGCINDRVGFQL